MRSASSRTLLLSAPRTPLMEEALRAKTAPTVEGEGRRFPEVISPAPSEAALVLQAGGYDTQVHVHAHASLR